MKQTRLLMGMPIAVEIVGITDKRVFDEVYAYFTHIDAVFSTYKTGSEIMRIRDGLPETAWSEAVKELMQLAEQTKQATNGYFDVYKDGTLDPSGLVKGWAVHTAAQQLHALGHDSFCIDAGGDMQTGGVNEANEPWQVGIRSPFNREEVVKVVALSDQGIATSGTAIRGQHIYDPHDPGHEITDVASITVIGPNVYEADRFATAAFAMGAKGVEFIESQPGLEAYMITPDKRATMTSRFEDYVV